MSLIPEFIFQSVIKRGLQTFRNDTRFLDQLFRNLDQESASDMRNFFLKEKIGIDCNYPREALMIPAIIILLKSESESQAFLGDTMGVDCEPDSMSHDTYAGTELEDEIMGGAATVSTLSGQGALLFGPERAASGTANTLKAAYVGSCPWNSSQFIGKGQTVHLIGGTGAGQQRDITANSADTLMVSPNWTQIPDATTVYVIKNGVDEIIGQPRAIFDKSGPRTERLGGLYNLNYQIQLIGPNQEFTIYLHAIVKSIMTLARTFLEGQGIINMQLGATDFVPRAEYQPEHAYMRALNVDFQYPFDIFKEMGDLATSFNIQLEQGGEPCEVVLSESDC